MKMYLELVLRLKDRRGVVLIVVASMLVGLLGFAALAVDIGYAMVLRNELQDAADAAALAGANVFYPPTPAPSTPLDWTAAEVTAAEAIRLNKAAGTTLTDCQAETGYWNLGRNPFGLQNKGITPGATDAPAVKVTVSRSAGNNGGPVRLFFGRVLGRHFASVSAAFNLDSTNDHSGSVISRSDRSTEIGSAIPSGVIIAVIGGETTGYIGVGGGVYRPKLPETKSLFPLSWRIVF